MKNVHKYQILLHDFSAVVASVKCINYGQVFDKILNYKNKNTIIQKNAIQGVNIFTKHEREFLICEKY